MSSDKTMPLSLLDGIFKLLLLTDNDYLQQWGR